MLLLRHECLRCAWSQITSKVDSFRWDRKEEAFGYQCYSYMSAWLPADGDSPPHPVLCPHKLLSGPVLAGCCFVPQNKTLRLVSARLKDGSAIR